MRRFLARLVLLVAVLLMPLGMAPADAGPHDMQPLAAMPMGHCDQHAPADHSKRGIADCTMACSAALPAVDAAIAEPAMTRCTPAVRALTQLLHGLRPETATPPPKRS